MTGNGNDFDDRVLGPATGVGATPPAPSADLLRAVDGMKPVRHAQPLRGGRGGRARGAGRAGHRAGPRSVSP